MICRYIEWSLHEPYSGVYVFEEQADIEHFLTIAMQENMLVLIRPGPFVSAERDFVCLFFCFRTNQTTNSLNMLNNNILIIYWNFK